MAHDIQFDTAKASQFVTEGVLLAMPLCMAGVTQPPPAGEQAINVLTVTDDRRICIGTSGPRARVLAGRIHSESGAVRHVAAIDDATSIDALIPATDESQDVWVIASGPVGSALWRCAATVPRSLVQEWGRVTSDGPAKVCDLFAEIGVAHAVRSGQTTVGVNCQGTVFTIDAEGAKMQIIGEVAGPISMQTRLVCDASDRVWGAGGDGRLWMYDPAIGKVQVTDLTAPCVEQPIEDVTWAADGASGFIYGAANPGGTLFMLDPDQRTIEVIGQPSQLGAVGCLAAGHDGRLYGAAGTADDIGHLFCFDPAERTLRNLGVAVSTLTVRQYGYHFRSAAVGAGGEIYLGQHERVSHLWIWFPHLPAGG